MEKTKYFSWKIGKLAKGCRVCVRGKKLVVFVTGLCCRKCYYCPISDRKYGKDVVYANEVKVKRIKDIINEAKINMAEGAGITGGDPLIKLNRTIKIIKALKKEFGKNFHIHLYTSLNLINENAVKKLINAGLDELRVHPDLDNNRLWYKIEFISRLRKEKNFDFGVEIPVVPGKENKIKELIKFIEGKVDFLNMNELEIAETKQNKLVELGFIAKNDESSGVKGSEELALRIMKFIEKNGIKINVHYCTSKLKDSIQFGNRIKLRAKNIAKIYDYVTKEGILVRGSAFFKYPYKKIKNKRKVIEILKKIRNELVKKVKIEKKFIDVDGRKLRLLMPVETIKENREIIKKYGLVPAIVKEYPIANALELEIDFL